MLRISRLSDYAVVILAHLAQAEGKGATARSAAESTGLPFPAVSKILKSLVRSGLLVSQRGSRGGYHLAISPQSLSVVRIIEAVDGPFNLTDCKAPESGDWDLCEYTGACRLEAQWKQINRLVRGALDSVTLADMLGDTQLVQLRLRHPVEALPHSGNDPDTEAKLNEALG